MTDPEFLFRFVDVKSAVVDGADPSPSQSNKPPDKVENRTVPPAQ